MSTVYAGSDASEELDLTGEMSRIWNDAERNSGVDVDELGVDA
jgi:hypothetical protein